MIYALGTYLRRNRRIATDGDLSSMCRDWLQGHYAALNEPNFDHINWDVVDLRWTIDAMNNNYYAYGNLYTYMLCSGIAIPYYDWIYDDVFDHAYKQYRFDKDLGYVEVHDYTIAAAC